MLQQSAVLHCVSTNIRHIQLLHRSLKDKPLKILFHRGEINKSICKFPCFNMLSVKQITEPRYHRAPPLSKDLTLSTLFVREDYSNNKYFDVLPQEKKGRGSCIRRRDHVSKHCWFCYFIQTVHAASCGL